MRSRAWFLAVTGCAAYTVLGTACTDVGLVPEVPEEETGAAARDGAAASWARGLFPDPANDPRCEHVGSEGGVDEYRCETRTTPRTRSDDDIWFVCRYRVRIYELGGRFTITVDFLRCWIGDPDDGGEEEPSLTLDCPATPLRGSTASCVASLEGGSEDTVAVVFEWKSNHANRTDSSGTGESTWGGVATDTIDITVTVTTGEENKDTLSDTKTVSVKARSLQTDFKFSQLNAPVDTVSGAGWPGGRWGVHDASDVVQPKYVAGSGPWAGQYVLEAPPTIDNVIEVHSDFASHGDVYPGAYAAADSLCGRPQPPIPDSASVYDVNDKCQALGNLQTWHRWVLDHERLHEKSGNLCLASGDAAAEVLQKLEGLTGTLVDVSGQLTIIWDEFQTGPLNAAFNAGIASPVSPYIWDYRLAGSWIYGSLTGGPIHSGTWGC